jgi:hypothetical protein
MVVTMTLVMELEGRRWKQSFTQEYLDQRLLTEELRSADFSFTRWVGTGDEWFCAKPC